MKGFVLAAALGSVLIAAVPAFADVDDCYSAPGNLVVNCGFENGSYTSTINGSTDTNVPVSWTPNQAFDSEPSFNQVIGGPIVQGSNALSIGNFDNQDTPVLSQTLGDQSGAIYNGTIWVNYGGGVGGDPAAFFDVLINGAPVLALNDLIPAGYSQFTFSFVGTGSDILSLAAKTNPNEWKTDDISVIGSGTSGATPEPAEFLPLAFLGAGLLLMRRRMSARTPKSTN